LIRENDYTGGNVGRNNISFLSKSSGEAVNGNGKTNTGYSASYSNTYGGNSSSYGGGQYGQYTTTTNNATQQSIPFNEY